ncbi:MAG: MFS transporter [Pseudoruegeria sp.]
MTKAVPNHRRIWGWMMFDWASQPYATLLTTFIFAPFFAEVVTTSLIKDGMDQAAAGAKAQAYWGYGLTITGLCIAFLAPILGAVADAAGRRLPWIWLFSVIYFIGACGLWYTHPDGFNIPLILAFFGLGLFGAEFALIFTNAMLPSLGSKEQMGRISGTGWALGYVGGVTALALTLVFLAENANGVTLTGSAPVFGLDPDLREGTRSVGPLTAVWFAVFMIPFFIWVKEPAPDKPVRFKLNVALRDLMKTIKALPNNRSLAAYLGSSMFYRDALNGLYTFGGIYALGVLGWSVVEVGVFGITAAITGAIFAYIGGHADARFGPKPVINTSIIMLLIACLAIVSISRSSIMGIVLPEGSSLPDILFYICGAIIGGAGGALQSASRTMLVRQANPKRLTEAFGLFALAGRATSFIAPAAIAIASDVSGSQRIGIMPLIALFLIGFVLLRYVKSDNTE